jgi:hypothetical protein
MDVDIERNDFRHNDTKPNATPPFIRFSRSAGSLRRPPAQRPRRFETHRFRLLQQFPDGRRRKLQRGGEDFKTFLRRQRRRDLISWSVYLR